jgi:hypothetical protein
MIILYYFIHSNILMIRIIIYSIIVISGLYSTRPDIFAQLSTIDNTSPSITQDITTVIDSSNLDNPIRQGSRFGIENPTNPTNSAINVIKTNIQNF